MQDAPDKPNDFARMLELHEATYWSDYYRATTREVEKICGTRLAKLGDAQVTVAAKIDMLAFNRVIGLGIQEPASEEQVDELVEIYKNAGARRFFVQVSPNAHPDELTKWLKNRGFVHHNNWAKLCRKVTPIPDMETTLRIEQIDESQANRFADMIVTCFEWPEALKLLIAGPVGRVGWKHYLAYKGSEAIACAACYTHGAYAALAFAATLPGYRGQGAQSALIARRIQDCAAAGCQWLMVETAEDKPERPVASYRNLRRFGFEVAYQRPNYLLNLE